MGAFAAAALSLSLFEFRTAPDVPKAPPPVTEVVVASHAIARGEIVGQQDIGARRLEGGLPVGALRAASFALGHAAARDIGAGAILSRGDLIDAASAGIAARVPEGLRAFAVRVSEEDIVGGFLQSGDRVDVFATIPGTVFPAKNASDVPDRSETLLLLQNVSVLAVGESLATKGSVQSSARTVSVAVTTDQLGKLALAQRFGKLSLAIRNPSDKAVAADERITFSDLNPNALAAKPAAQHVTTGHTNRNSASGVPFLAGAQWSTAP
jgi:pilus assembly protein CpaB